MKEKVPVSIKYIDKDVYEKLCSIAAAKNRQLKSKTDLFAWILKDYIDMHDIDEYRNPYLLNHISNTIEASNRMTEKRLGGRMFTVLSEAAIGLSVLTMQMDKYMNQYSDPLEVEKEYQQMRYRAVEHLRQHDLAPMTYLDVIKEPEES